MSAVMLSCLSLQMRVSVRVWSPVTEGGLVAHQPLMSPTKPHRIKLGLVCACYAVPVLFEGWFLKSPRTNSGLLRHMA